MAWYNPLDWGKNDPEMYDPNSANARAARTFGGPNKQYDINSAQTGMTDSSQSDQVRNRQGGLADTLNSAISGQGPSAAGMTGAAQRDANLAQSAALASGRRGQGAGSALRMGNNAVIQGNQMAAQNESIGRANEMTQARGELGNVLSGMRGQDQQNMQLNQNNNQFNASQRQNADLANQAARLGISQQEMQARLHQGDMEFSNLDPGSKGILSDVATGIGSMIGSKMARGGVVDVGNMPRYAEGGVIGIGSRRTPVSKGDLSVARDIAQSIMGFVGAMQAAKPAPEAAAPVAPTDAPLPGVPPIPPGIGMMAGLPIPMAKGGISRGPQTALVGEAGPEVILEVQGVVDRPTVTRLGGRGRPQAVVPLNPHQGNDRKRVLGDIVKLAQSYGGRRDS